MGVNAGTQRSCIAHIKTTANLFANPVHNKYSTSDKVEANVESSRAKQMQYKTIKQL